MAAPAPRPNSADSCGRAIETTSHPAVASGSASGARAVAEASSPAANAAATTRLLGVHSAWATARHNGLAASLEDAAEAWDAAAREGGDSADWLERAKLKVLGVGDLGAFDEVRSRGGTRGAATEGFV